MSLKNFINTVFLKNKFFNFHLLSASICTIVLFYFLLIYLDKYTLNGEEFELPDFKSLTIEELDVEIKSLGLDYEIIDSVYTDSVDRGTIFMQAPLSGTFIKKGRKIYITVNCLNRQKFTIPDIYNKSERQAINQLKSNFNTKSIKSLNYSEVSSVVVKMKVGEMEVFPGQKLISGTTIKLFFGSGRVSNKIELPNMIGTTLEDSYLLLKENNLNIGEIIFNGVISDTLKAFVYNQRPMAESKLQFGDMVDLEIKQTLDTTISMDSIFIK